MKNSISLFFATVFFLSLFSCTEKEEPTVDNLADYRFEFAAVKSMGDDSSAGQGSVDTRVLTENGNDLKATFKKGDLVYMYKVTLDDSRHPIISSYKKVGVLTSMDDGVETDLVGPIDPDLLSEFYEDEFTGRLLPNNENFALYFFYKHDPVEGFNFQGQKGTLEDIDNNFDFACAQIFTSSSHYEPGTNTWGLPDYLEIDWDNKRIKVPNKIRFHSQQSVFKFSLKDKSGKPIKADKFTIETEAYHEGPSIYIDPNRDYNVFIQSFNPLAGNNDLQKGKIEVNPETASDKIYVALAGTYYSSINNNPDNSYSKWTPLYFSSNSLLSYSTSIYSSSSDSNRNLNITATVGDLTYRYSKPYQSWLGHGYFYNIEVRMDGPVTDPTVNFDVTNSSRYGEGQTIN